MVSTQIEKKYGSDWAKSRSRGLVREMIERNLLTLKKPEDIYALCFPGVDVAEIFEVYDPLGIPRWNIYALEREAEVAEELRGRNLGINVYNKDFEEFSHKPVFGFDIISTDYTGPISDTDLESLQRVVSRNNRSNLVVHIANLLKRDRNSTGIYSNNYFRLTYEEAALLHINLTDGALNDFDQLWCEMNKMADNLPGAVRDIIERKENDLKHFKERAFTSALVRSIVPDIREAADAYTERIKRECGITGSQTQGGVEFLLNASHEHLERIIENADHFDERTRAEFRGLSRKRKRMALSTVIDSKVMEEWGRLGVKFITDAEKYSYVSESGAPMIGDAFFLTNCEGFWDFNPLSLLVRSSDTIRKDRKFLGSSARPVLTKARAIQEFRDGATVADVKAKYRGIANKPLAQWKAHVTMGSYDESTTENEVEIGRSDQEDSDLEKITKEEAIDMIISGIPIAEINAAFPTSFSIGQLRAYKAHSTMGTYEEAK